MALSPTVNAVHINEKMKFYYYVIHGTARAKKHRKTR